MHTRNMAAVGLAVAAALGLAACNSNDTSASKPPTTATTAVAKDLATTAAPKATTASNEPTPVPRLIGMGLQSAQDTAQAAGFYNLTSHDSAGRDREQVLDRNWKVCSQNLAAGKKASTDVKLDLGAVKIEETCPASDKAPPAKAGAVMPDFVGKGLNTARDSLDSGTSITATDATGSRMILLESNWEVCTQDPAAGSALQGQPVEFTAVKFGESCP